MSKINKYLLLSLTFLTLFGVDGCNNETQNQEDYLNNNANFFDSQTMNEKMLYDSVNDNNLKSEIIECEDIEKIIISFDLYSSIKLYIECQEEIDLITGLLNSDKKQVFDEIDYSIYDIDTFIDILYKEKTISILILSNDNVVYYFIDDIIYTCTTNNHQLLLYLLIQKYIDNIPDISDRFIWISNIKVGGA